jgi:hypothetical protein
VRTGLDRLSDRTFHNSKPSRRRPTAPTARLLDLWPRGYEQNRAKSAPPGAGDTP